ncbi:hypothetical protein, partial [Bacillus cereus]|uniref:hypothetical protein n=1 Tax=Bacillus cereus TaxID=1396 RepID=UPI001C3F448B
NTRSITRDKATYCRSLLIKRNLAKPDAASSFFFVFIDYIRKTRYRDCDFKRIIFSFVDIRLLNDEIW